MQPEDDNAFSPFRRSSRSQSFSKARRLDASNESDVTSGRADSDVDDAWNRIAIDLERIEGNYSEYNDFENWDVQEKKTSASPIPESAPNADLSARESLRRASNALPAETYSSNNDDKLSEDYETRSRRRNKSVWDGGDWARVRSNEKASRGRSSSYDRQANASDRSRSPNRNLRRGFEESDVPRGCKRRRDELTNPTRRPTFSSQTERDANFKKSGSRFERSNDQFRRSERFDDGNSRQTDENSRRQTNPSSSGRNVGRRPNSRRRPEFKSTLGLFGRYGEPLSIAEEYAEKYARIDDPNGLNASNDVPENAPVDLVDESVDGTLPELAALREKSVYELIDEARRPGDGSRREIVKRALRERVIQAGFMLGRGTLEILPDGFGFLRSVETSYLSCSDDIYVSPSQIRRFGLRSGLVVSGLIRPPKERERYFALLRIEAINDRSPASLASTPCFDDLVAARSTERLKFERTVANVENALLDDLATSDSIDSSRESTDEFASLFSASTLTPTLYEAAESSRGRDMRLLDLVLPLGFGQRALIVCPPRAGKTALLRKMIASTLENYDDVSVYVLLVKKRPEDVTETRRALASERCEVVGSTFDEDDLRHVQVARMVFEKAKRAVENGKNVVVFVDSLTRLICARRDEEYGEQNLAAALQRVRKLFGSSRKIDGGGSLTVVATTLWNQDSAEAQAELEALQTIAHATLWLDSELAEKNIWPPVNVVKSVARDCRDFVADDERLLLEKIREKTRARDATDAIGELLDKIARTSNNLELLRAWDSDSSEKNDDVR